MGVLKKTSSGRALQFITDEGVVYQLSFKLFMMVVNDGIKGDFVVLSRMPFGVPPGRFPKSVVYGGGGSVQSAVDRAGVDVFSKDFLHERKEQKAGVRASEFRVDW